MADLVSFEDAASELGVTTQEVTSLVSSGDLKTGEEGGLVMITRESLNLYRTKQATAPIHLTPEEGEEETVKPTISLAPDEGAAQVEEVRPAAAEATPGEKTESIFGDEGFELETFEEAEVAEVPGAELAELEEAGEELGAEEMAELTSLQEVPARRRAMAAPSETSTALTVVAVLTFVILVFGGIVIFNFFRNSPQSIVKPITQSLPINLGGQ